ncbi:MAG: C40 family peptidase [Acidimicrobiia bacterium]|nr:C40 family peptidase [Acidimicrobiia bacterium]
MRAVSPRWGSRTRYSSAAADRDESIIDDLSIARELLDARMDDLAELKAAAEAESSRLEESRSEVEAARVEQERLLSQVKGEIAELVRQEEIRRQEEAERLAREELARRQAAEEAARRAAAEAAAASDSDSGSGSSGTYTPPPDVPAPNPNAQTAVDTAKAQLGKPYSWGASGPSAFDCSGLTMYAWAAAGVGLPHSSRAQYSVLPHVPMDALAPGDLVFYGNPIHHVGIYVGGGQYINAPQTGDVVKVSSIYRSDFAGAGRPG